MLEREKSEESRKSLRKRDEKLDLSRERRWIASEKRSDGRMSEVAHWYRNPMKETRDSFAPVHARWPTRNRRCDRSKSMSLDRSCPRHMMPPRRHVQSRVPLVEMLTSPRQASALLTHVRLSVVELKCPWASISASRINNAIDDRCNPRASRLGRGDRSGSMESPWNRSKEVRCGFTWLIFNREIEKNPRSWRQRGAMGRETRERSKHIC